MIVLFIGCVSFTRNLDGAEFRLLCWFWDDNDDDYLKAREDMVKTAQKRFPPDEYSNFTASIDEVPFDVIKYIYEQNIDDELELDEAWEIVEI
jgi:hypothetical protein